VVNFVQFGGFFVKKSKLFLAGIPGILLVFGLMLTGCATNDDSITDPSNPPDSVASAAEAKQYFYEVWGALFDSQKELFLEVIEDINDKLEMPVEPFENLNDLPPAFWEGVTDNWDDIKDDLQEFVDVVKEENNPTPPAPGSMTWTAVTDAIFASGNFNAIAYGGGKFVAVGHNGKAAYSANGVSWTGAEKKLSASNGIAWGGGKFVSVGYSGQAEYSEDGISWTAVTDTTFASTTINCIAWGGGKFVAGGDSGKAAYSADGISWTAVADTTFDDSTTIKCIAWGDGKFVAGGEHGKAAYSEDGINWTAVADTTFASTTIKCIAYGGGKFVAGGEDVKAYSADGVSWTRADETQSTSKA
jgi:hypothetical protein